jgi:hypothetical protein
MNQPQYFTAHISGAHGIIPTKTSNHELYILEQPSSCSTARIHPSWPRCRLRLSLLQVSSSVRASCYHAHPNILLFIFLGWVSHLMPSLLSGWLLTNVQVNGIIKLHNTHKHSYIYASHRHYYSSLLLTLLPLFLAGWLLQTLPV